MQNVAIQQSAIRRIVNSFLRSFREFVGGLQRESGAARRKNRKLQKLRASCYQFPLITYAL
jgi:hypothetical protein